MSTLNLFCKLFFVIFLFIAHLASASDLVLKTGEKLKGKILERTDKYVKFDSGIGVGTTYYSDEIESVDGQTFETPKAAVPVVKEIANTTEVVETTETQESTEAVLPAEIKKVAESPVAKPKAALENTGSLYHSKNVGVSFNLPQGWSVNEITSLSAYRLYLIPPEALSDRTAMILRNRQRDNKPDGVPNPMRIGQDKTILELAFKSGFKCDRVNFQNEKTVNINGLLIYTAEYTLTPSEKGKGEIYIFYKGGYAFDMFTNYKGAHAGINPILNTMNVDDKFVRDVEFEDYQFRIQMLSYILVVSYIFMLICTYFIAKKLEIPEAWWSFIPFMQPLIICKIIEVNPWWLLAPVLLLVFQIPLWVFTNVSFLLPTIIGFFILHVFVNYKIVKVLNKPSLWVLWTSIPVLNLGAWGYLAFFKE